jgi:hypothetical protein
MVKEGELMSDTNDNEREQWDEGDWFDEDGQNLDTEIWPEQDEPTFE